MTGHVCPECGVHRPGCACVQAEIAAAEDFDPLRIRPYVTLDAPDGLEGPRPPSGPAAAAPYGGDPAAGDPKASYGAGPASPDAAATAYLPAYTTDDPPTAQLAAIRRGGPAGTEAPPEGGDPSETMPLLLRGVGEVSPAHGGERPRGRRRGVVVAAVAAVAVAGTAALAAVVLGGDDTDDRAAVPEVTTSASLNVAVSEAPSPSSTSPEPSSSSPTPDRTSASPSPSPSATRTTTSPSPSTSGAVAPPATSTAPTTAPPTTSASAQPPQETEEAGVTLSLGASGPEVRELQLRLQALWIYSGRINGKYGREVEEAVATYQRWLYPQTDPEGVYGAFTRSHLEAATPDI
ncbi:peptidoglycan-binding domain-containing protein [Streptomyces sp. LMG1-1-1.1]|uniref:peptidoglycan-binding domain-containing protein n=1 Tax=Streptomyces sp. LMG1-1-1.1 TaxID=3135245 RepID=UPI0034672DBE